MSYDLQQRIEAFARRLEALNVELELLKRDAAGHAVATAPAPPPVVFLPAVQPAAAIFEPQGGSRPPFPAPTAEVPFSDPAAWRPPQWTPPRLSAADLLGPRALAIAGGIVTLLGIVFFFVLAVNRGWIGPGGRVALGAGAAALVFAAGHGLRRRYGATHSALAAVGAGIAGGYATLLSAAALYDLLPNWGALLLAAGIAVAGLATALLWQSELVAGLGLIGAILVPLALVTQEPLSPLGTAFAAVVFVAVAIVEMRMGWRELLIAGGLATAGQLVGLFSEERYRFEHPARVLALVAFVALVFLATGVGRQLRSKFDGLDSLASTFSVGGAALAVAGVSFLFATDQQRGLAFLVIVAVYAAAGAFFFLKPATRDLSALLTFVTFSLGAIAVSEILTGQPLAYAWAAEAAGLAWLARQVREPRFQAWSVLYFLLALGHVLTVDAKPRNLLTSVVDPATGAPAALAVAAAAAVCWAYARPWTVESKRTGVMAAFTAYWIGVQPRLRWATAWAAAAVAVYAASLWTLALSSSFEWGTVAVAGLWTSIGVVMFGTGAVRGFVGLRAGGLVWLLVTGALAVEQAARLLGPTPRACLFAIVGFASLGVSVAYSLFAWRSSLEEPDATALAAMVAALALFIYPIASLLSGRTQGAALLGVAAVWALVSAALFVKRSRDFSTLYWAVAVGLVAIADAELLQGTYMGLGWAAAGVAVAWLAGRVREPRLYGGAGVFLALAVGRALIVQAPPTHLFHPRVHPAYGAASLFIAALAVTVAAYLATAELRRLGAFRTLSWWLAGALTVYGLSFLIIELVEQISAASLDTAFQRGQTGVSAFWGLLGLALLYAGLKRGWRALRVAGLALFPIVLAKIFFFDLPSLSSITRAFSFLAVGFVLLLGGFFYQRLSSERDEPKR